MATRAGTTVDVYDTSAELDPSEPIGQLALTLDPLTIWVFTATGYVAVGSPTGDAPPSVASEAGQGIVELATEAEVQAGTAGVLVTTVARLKAEFDRRLSLAFTPEAWITPTLVSSWVAATGYDSPGYRKEPGGLVRLKGTIANGTTSFGTTLFTLPAGYRPSGDKVFAVGASGTSATEIRVATTGALTIQDVPASNTFLSLEGVVFTI